MSEKTPDHFFEGVSDELIFMRLVAVQAMAMTRVIVNSPRESFDAKSFTAALDTLKTAMGLFCKIKTSDSANNE